MNDEAYVNRAPVGAKSVLERLDDVPHPKLRTKSEGLFMVIEANQDTVTIEWSPQYGVDLQSDTRLSCTSATRTERRRREPKRGYPRDNGAQSTQHIDTTEHILEKIVCHEDTPPDLCIGSVGFGMVRTATQRSLPHTSRTTSASATTRRIYMTQSDEKRTS